MRVDREARFTTELSASDATGELNEAVAASYELDSPMEDWLRL